MIELGHQEHNDFPQLVDTIMSNDQIVHQQGTQARIEIHGCSGDIVDNFGNLAHYILQPISMWKHIARFVELESI